MLVLCKDVVHESSAAAPVSQDEQRVILNGLVGQKLLVLAFLQGHTHAQQTADGLGEIELCLLVRGNMLALGYGLECLPVGAHQGVDRKFAEFNQSHILVVFYY